MLNAALRDWVVIIVAVALGTALNMVTFAVLWDALFGKNPGLSDNALQLLTGWGGGIIGIIGAFVGARAGAEATAAANGHGAGEEGQDHGQTRAATRPDQPADAARGDPSEPDQ